MSFAEILEDRKNIMQAKMEDNEAFFIVTFYFGL